MFTKIKNNSYIVKKKRCSNDTKQTTRTHRQEYPNLYLDQPMHYRPRQTFHRPITRSPAGRMVLQRGFTPLLFNVRSRRLMYMRGLHNFAPEVLSRFWKFLLLSLSPGKHCIFIFYYPFVLYIDLNIVIRVSENMCWFD